MAKAKSNAQPPRDAAAQPEPAVMAAGASEENALEGKGAPPADLPDAKDQKPGSDAAAPLAADEPKAAAAPQEAGFRDDSGRFTGNPPTDAERIDAIVDMLERNGMSLPKVLHRPKE